MDCHVTTGHLDRSVVMFYLAVALAVGAGAMFSKNGRVILRHVFLWCLVALLTAAHRWLPGYPLVQLVRDAEKTRGSDVPVLIEHFATGILCVWAASIAVRALPWLAAEARQRYQERPLPTSVSLALLSMLPMAVAIAYRGLGGTLIWTAPVALLGAFTVACVKAPAQTWEWASKHQSMLLAVIAIAAWLTLSLSFGLCQYQTHDPIVARNANQQLSASFCALVFGLLARLRYRAWRDCLLRGLRAVLTACNSY